MVILMMNLVQVKSLLLIPKSYSINQLPPVIHFSMKKTEQSNYTSSDNVPYTGRYNSDIYSGSHNNDFYIGRHNRKKRQVYLNKPNLFTTPKLTVSNIMINYTR